MEDARHSSVLYVCKCSVGQTHSLFCDSPLLSGRDPPPYEHSNVFSNPRGVGRPSGTPVWRRWLSRLLRCAPRWGSIPPSATGRTSTGTGSWPSSYSRSSMHTRWENRGDLGLNQCCGSGSEGYVCFWASRIRILPSSGKKVRKSLISTVL